MKNPRAKIWLDAGAMSVVIALALFLSAGTIGYWQAWAYLGVSAVSSVPLIVVDDGQVRTAIDRLRAVNMQATLDS